MQSHLKMFLSLSLYLILFLHLYRSFSPICLLSIYSMSVSSVPPISLSLVSYYIFLPFFYYLFQHSLTISFSHPSPLSFLTNSLSILPLSHVFLSLFRPPPLVLAFFYPSSLYLTVSLLSNSLLSSMHFFHPLPLVLMSSTLPRFISLMAYCLFNLSHLSSLKVFFISISLPHVSNSLLLSLLSSYCLSPPTFATKKTKFKCSR